MFFIGPESDHWLCLSLTPYLTHSLTHCCLVNLIDVTLACKNANSKLVEVVTVAVGLRGLRWLEELERHEWVQGA